jgi:hypothetical protein
MSLPPASNPANSPAKRELTGDNSFSRKAEYFVESTVQHREMFAGAFNVSVIEREGQRGTFFYVKRSFPLSSLLEKNKINATLISNNTRDFTL